MPSCFSAKWRCRSPKPLGARLSAPPPRRVDADAYQSYVQAREMQTRSVQSNWRDVRDLYRSAVDRDPNFVQAWAALARAEANVANEALDSGPANAVYTPEMVAPALAAAQRAISLDDGLAEPYMVRESSVYSWRGDWLQAANAVRAGEARGGHAWVLSIAPWVICASCCARAATLFHLIHCRPTSGPTSPSPANTWTTSLANWRPRSGLTIYLPMTAPPRAIFIPALVANNRQQDAWLLLQQMHWQTNTDLGTRVLRWKAVNGAAPRATEVLAALNRGNEYIDTAVGLLADLREWDAAARLIDRWGPPSRSYIFSLFRAQWAPLRQKPQFWALMQREGLLRFWRVSRRWPDFCEKRASMRAV